MPKKNFLVYLSILLTMPMSNSPGWATTTAPPESAESTNTKASPSKGQEELEPAFCSTKAFLNSDFIRSSVWPGIGPFDSTNQPGSTDKDQSIQLSDPSHNQLNYKTAGNQINYCELELHNCIGESQGLLNLQMGTDFLLEGLGVKPTQIHTINMELSKKSKLLTSNNYNPISVTIAPLTVSFQNLGIKEGTSSPIFRTAIVYQANSNDQASPHEQTSSKTTAPIESQTSNIDSASSTAASSSESQERSIESAQTTNENSPAQSEKINDENQAETAITPAPQSTHNETSITGTEPKSAESKPIVGKNEQLKNEFLKVITNWQRVKKTAVRQHQTNELSQVLASQALTKQSDAIKWLASNHRCYEMLSQGAKVDHFNMLIPNKKYTVYAEVKEKSKYIDEVSQKTIKEVDDTYNVNYTIEKIGQHWLITDSALIKQGGKKSGKPTQPSIKTTR